MKKIVVLFSIFTIVGCNRFEDQKIDLDCNQSKLLVPDCIKDTSSMKSQALEEDKLYRK